MRRLVVDLAATSKNWSLTPEGERLIRDAAPDGWETEVVRSPTISDGDGASRPSSEALAAVREAEAYVGFGISRALFVAAPTLRWVHSAAAGVGAVLFDEMRRSEALLTNSAGVHAVPIAEHVTAGVLHLLRALDIAGVQQRERRWDKAPFVNDASRVRELGDSRVLVIGAGGLGSAIAQRLSAFGASCTGVRRRPELGPPAGFDRVVGPDALDVEIPAADIVVLSAPSTPATTGLLDARRIALLPRGAIVVNVARGALLDESALVNQIERGHLRGAVLDVFSEEPLPASSPLWALPNIVLTPHVSAVSPARFWERELSLFTDNWRRYARGEPLRNLVDKQAGY